MRAGVAGSMNGSRAPAVHGEPPAATRGRRPPSSARSDGRKRLDEACVIRLDRIVADPDQPRKEFDPEALGRLAESLKARGQLQPIRVRWDDAADRYVVVVGERRWRAARLAGLETIACVVVDRDAVARGPPGGPARRELPPRGPQADRAGQGASGRLMAAAGLTQRQLAERLQIGHAVDRPGARAAGPARADPGGGRAGEIAPNTAYELSKVEDPGEQAALAKEAAEGRLRRDALTERTRTPRQGRGAPKAWAHTAGRVRVTLSPLAEDVTDEELTEALRSAPAAGGRRAAAGRRNLAFHREPSREGPDAVTIRTQERPGGAERWAG